MTGYERLSALCLNWGGFVGKSREAPRRARPLALCRAAIAILALATLSGCGGIPPLTSVSNLDFRLVDEQAQYLVGNELVPPGSRMTLEATAVGTTRDGEQVQRAVTQWQNYLVEVSGGSYDPGARNVWFSVDENAVPAQGYQVSVIHIATGFRSTKQFQPDFARIDGPEPGDVTALDTYLMQDDYRVPPGTPLIPGETYTLEVMAVDRLGRTFSSADSSFPIPAARVDVTLTNFQRTQSGPFAFLAAENASPAPDSFRIDSAYRDSDFTGKLSYGFDPAIARGPHPESVSAIELSGPLGGANRIPPGAVEVLDVRVTDNSGRSWRLDMPGMGSHRANEYPLPTDRIDVEINHGTYDRNSGFVHFDGDAKGLLGESFAVSVTYAGDGELLAHRSYDPDFLSIVPLMEEDTLVYEGRAGNDGARGRDGPNGRAGADARDPDENIAARSADRGGDGQLGHRGGNGGFGSPGPHIHVAAQEVSTVDGVVPLVLLEISVLGETRYFVRRLDSAPLTIVSRGGDGGDGGRGGSGGSGGSGGDGTPRYISQSGGNGADGTDGGDGAAGGDSGDVTLILEHAGLERAFVLRSLSGQAGTGGEAGAGGAGGAGGNDGAGDIGSSGARGLAGRRGRDGNPGLRGRTSVTVQPGGAAVASSAPQSLRSVIRYE